MLIFLLFSCEAQTSWIQRKTKNKKKALTSKQGRKELKSTILRQERVNMAKHSGLDKGRKFILNYHSARPALNMKFHFKIA